MTVKFHFWTVYWVAGRTYAERHEAESPIDARRAHRGAMAFLWVPADADGAQVTALFADNRSNVRTIAPGVTRGEDLPPETDPGDTTRDRFERGS